MFKLTQEYLKTILKYENGNLIWIKTSNYHKRRIGTVSGYKRPDGYMQIRIKDKSYLLHRLVWLYHNGEFPTKDLDHINFNTKDNRIENLREATKSENQWNIGITKQNTSGFKGVSYDKRRGTWNSAVTIKSKKKYLGAYKTPEEAGEVYIKHIKEHHSEFIFKDYR